MQHSPYEDITELILFTMNKNGLFLIPEAGHCNNMMSDNILFKGNYAQVF